MATNLQLNRILSTGLQYSSVWKEFQSKCQSLELNLTWNRDGCLWNVFVLFFRVILQCNSAV